MTGRRDHDLKFLRGSGEADLAKAPESMTTDAALLRASAQRIERAALAAE